MLQSNQTPLVTPEQFKAMFPISGSKLQDKYYPDLENALRKFQINTPPRIAAFLAQVAHESGNLVYTQELADGHAYDNRKDLGNTRPEAIAIAKAAGKSPGEFLKGEGLIQVTGYNNLLKCGEALGIDAVHNPELLRELPYAWLSAAWFWNVHNCNALADAGLFGHITQTINGGFNGQKERVLYWNRNQVVMQCKLK